MQPVHTFKHANLNVEIHVDTDPESSNPRQEEDTVAVLYAWPRTHHTTYADAFAGTEDQEAPCDYHDFRVWLAGPFDSRIAQLNRGMAVTAVVISDVLDSLFIIEPFTTQSGRGYAVVRREWAAQHWHGTREEIEAAARVCIRQEVHDFDAWCEGAIYGYILKDATGRKVDEGSCWGLLGFDAAVQAAKERAEEVAPRHAWRLAEEDGARQRAQNIANETRRLKSGPNLTVADDAVVTRKGDSWIVTAQITIPI